MFTKNFQSLHQSFYVQIVEFFMRRWGLDENMLQKEKLQYPTNKKTSL